MSDVAVKSGNFSPKAALRHEAIESINGHEVLIDAPKPMDVICGRGKNIAHPGNRKFHMHVLSRKEDYARAKRRDEKTRITLELMQDFMQQGPEASRFLLKDASTNKWLVVDEDYVKEKISHALRSRPNETRRRRPRQPKRTSRKPTLAPDIEATVQKLIIVQQQLLKSMIDKHVYLDNYHGENGVVDSLKQADRLGLAVNGLE